MEMLSAGLRVRVLGNDTDKFENAKAYFLGALKAAVGVLDDDLFKELGGQALGPGAKSNRVFVVHGHDDRAKTSLEVFLREIGLEPVVLHRQPD
jgi:predicted nucleotide-binding protein